MIWPGLPAFLVQLALWLCRPLPVHMPAWYSYGGIIAPAMPQEYPYAVMTCADPSLYDGRNCTLYLFSGIPAVEDGAFKAWETELKVMVCRVRGNVWKKESAFTLPLGDSTAAQYGNFVWSNFDLYSLDSTLLLSASDPQPATDYATTLFEGDVTTAVEDYIITAPNGTQYPQTFNGAHAVISDGALFDDYGLIRLTVDKVPVGYKIQSLMLGSYVGNQWLLDVEKKDTGGSFAVMPTLLSGETLLLSREPGTYHVKVEKIERRAQIVELEMQWETLFEGEVVTITGDTFNGSQCLLPGTGMLFNGDEEIRLTVNGESKVYVAKGGQYGITASFGNDWLQSGKNSTVNPDTGEDYCVVAGAMSGTILFTRNPGTYQIKIERALTG